MLRISLKQLTWTISRLQLQSLQQVLPKQPKNFIRYFTTTELHRFIDGAKTTTTTAPLRNLLPPEDGDVDDLSDHSVFLNKGNPKLGKMIPRQEALQLLSDKLFLSRQAGEKLFKKETKLRYLNGPNFCRILELIEQYKISSDTVEEFPWILAMTSYNLRAKLDILIEMKPRKIDDFVPLLRISQFRLTKILYIMQAEQDIVPGGHRIYYLSEKLGLPAKTVCKYISTRLFMLELPIQSVMGTLEAMLDYDIAPQSIIRDLWAFRYNTKSIMERLERAKRAHKTKIMPWMIRCPERILQRCLRLAIEEKKVLGKNDDVYEYLSQRLGYDLESTKAIVAKHPAVAKVRVTKIKEILDYLLNEAGFTKHDVAQIPRILSHGLTTTKARLEELKSYGCVPSSLVIVCRSKREYNKFLKKWLDCRQKMIKTG